MNSRELPARTQDNLDGCPERIVTDGRSPRSVRCQRNQVPRSVTPSLWRGPGWGDYHYPLDLFESWDITNVQEFYLQIALGKFVFELNF